MDEIALKLSKDSDATIFLETLNSSIRKVASKHYSTDVIDSWAVSIDEKSLSQFIENPEQEIRILAYLGDDVAGIGSTVLSNCELRACYVTPSGLRRGVGTAIVKELERIAQAKGLSHLQLHATTIAEPFYRALGYSTIEPVEHITRGGYPMRAFSMRKNF